MLTHVFRWASYLEHASHTVIDRTVGLIFSKRYLKSGRAINKDQLFTNWNM